MNVLGWCAILSISGTCTVDKYLKNFILTSSGTVVLIFMSVHMSGVTAPPNSKLHKPTEPNVDNSRIMKIKGYFLSVIFHLPSCILTKIENTMQH